jgi:2-keto-4-pentenoate hydratase/2-oxohepta-3-ene-1,7-dioic acid hydratase in catechol pathway
MKQRYDRGGRTSRRAGHRERGDDHATGHPAARRAHPHPNKIICLGLNYATHIKEMGRDIITLLPGDLVATGTPGGVGDGRDPQVYLQPGQELATITEGLGELRNRCTAE